MIDTHKITGLPTQISYLHPPLSLSLTHTHTHTHTHQVVGEYSYVLEDIDTENILEKVTSLLTRRFEDKTTSHWVICCITKLVARLGSMPDSVQSQVAVYLASTDTEIQQV